MASTSQAYSDQLQQLNESRQPVLYGLNIALTLLATCAVSLRLFARRISKLPLSYDDYAILTALLGCYGLFIINMIMLHYGMGRHIEAIGFGNVPLFLRILYYYAMVYNFAITMTKIAILLFYDRIFVTRVFHVAVWAVATFTVLMSSSAFIVLIFPCQPIRFFWDKDLAVGHCLNYEAFITAEAALTIFLDIVILTMPMPLVWNLKVSRRQKATLSGIFLLGGFVCIASIMRLPTLHDIFTVDYTWNVCGASEWSLIEANLGVVCACLPLLRPFVVRFLRTSGATRQTSPSKFNSKSFLSLSTWSSKAGARNTLSSQPTDSNEAESGTFQRLDTPKELELRLDRIPREAGRITAPGKGFFDSEETAISEGFTPRSEEILRFHGQPLDDLPPVTNGV